MWKVVWVTNIYMVAIFFINTALGSNYVFLNTKPTTTSLFNVLPPWPYYIIFMELIGIACFLLLYLPFLIKDWRTRKASHSAPMTEFRPQCIVELIPAQIIQQGFYSETNPRRMSS